MNIIYLKLLVPLSFLRLRSRDLFWYKWFWPLIMSISLLFLFWMSPEKPSIFGDNGIIDNANSFLNMVIGFYIAALAAVATFSSENLDNVMKGDAPKVGILLKGRVEYKELTRRRFLCILFGYCAFSSITLYISSLMIKFSLPSAKRYYFFNQNIECFQFAWLAYYFFLSSSLLIATLLGLYYLIDRIHRP